MSNHDPKLAKQAAIIWPESDAYYAPQTPAPRPERQLSAIEQMYAYYEA
ncbi:hypothetical protein ACP2AV_05600 [Aliiroseovarius sp. PTFE2010]